MSDSNAMETTKLHDLYSDHHGWLRGWLRRRMDCSETAADLAQDTFVRLMKKRVDYVQSNGLGAEPRALLAHIAKGLVVDHWRRQDVERAYLEALACLPEIEEPSLESQYLIIEALTRIDRMLSEMSSKSRKMFLLAQLDGLTLQQISEQTQTPVITVRRHIRKALIACTALA